MKAVVGPALMAGVRKSSLRLPLLKSTSRDLPHLDLLRFVASCGIVFHHSIEFLVPRPIRAAVDQQTHGLALFVDLFFVISGFVISYVYHGRTNTLSRYGNFLQRRVGRLVPLHWVTLSISIIIFTTASTLGHVYLSQKPSSNAGCIALTAVLANAFIQCSGPAYNGVSWSISAEMGMYAAFPVFDWMARRNARLPLYIGSFTLVAILVTLAFSEQRVAFNSITWAALFAPLRALPSFLIGIGIFYNRRAVARFRAPAALLPTCTAVLICAMLLGAPAVVTLFGAYSVALLAITADLQGKTSSLLVRLFPLGQLTYSIYMLHSLFILIILNAVGDKILHARAPLAFALTILCYGCIMVASYLSFIFVETPARVRIDGLPIFRESRSAQQ